VYWWLKLSGAAGEFGNPSGLGAPSELAEDELGEGELAEVSIRSPLDATSAS